MTEWGPRRKFIARRGVPRRGPRSMAIRRTRIVKVVRHWQPPLERKFADVETSADAFATTWATMEDATNDSVSGVNLDDTESGRDGRVYHIQSIHVRVTVTAAQNEDVGNPIDDMKGRFCLVLDTQTNGAQMTATDVMDGGQTDDTLAFRNLQHTKRFQVYWDQRWTIKFDNMTNAGEINKYATGARLTRFFKFDKTFKKPIKVICQGTDATISSISDNSFHMIGVANSTAALLNYQVRIRFTA